MYSNSQTNQVQYGEIYNRLFEGVAVAERGITLKTPLWAETVIVKINNRDDRPLTIKDIQVEYSVDKLVFPDLGDKPYTLYWGNFKAEKPSYELELQRSYIEKEPQDICSLQGKQSNQQPSGILMKSDYVFNLTIVAVSLLLVVILVQKLRSLK